MGMAAFNMLRAKRAAALQEAEAVANKKLVNDEKENSDDKVEKKNSGKKGNPSKIEKTSDKPVTNNPEQSSVF